MKNILKTIFSLTSFFLLFFIMDKISSAWYSFPTILLIGLTITFINILIWEEKTYDH